jgi:hypothetical protein
MRPCPLVMRLRNSLGLTSLLVMMSLGGCGTVGTRAVETSSVSFVCEHGASFTVEFREDLALVHAGGNSYSLTPRPSSIGRRYGSDSVAFMQDEDRGVLVGAEGGPFRRCSVARLGLRQVRASEVSGYRPAISGRYQL